MQATPGLACERRFLARGAAAGSGAAPLAEPIGAEAPSNAIRHANISTSLGFHYTPYLVAVRGLGSLVEWPMGDE